MSKADQERIPWLRVIDEALVVAHLGTAEITDSYEEARRKLNMLIDFYVALATDEMFENISF